MLLPLLCLFSYFQLSQSETVHLRTNFGILKGNRSTTPSGFQYDLFAGVPFAEKALRFQKSEMIKKWSHVLDATKFPNRCHGKFPRKSGTYSEDCLYMNIITPSHRDKFENLPVVVFIHGGGFFSGSADDAPADQLAENFVSQDMVVVSIQYRLAAFGFLTLGCGSSQLPCNIGLWDQVTAIQFVNRIIGSFGGDNRRMTLMGHSAGSVSTGIHATSPFTSKYFNNFIELSGSFARQQSFPVVDISKEIISALNCSSPADSLDCLRKTSIEDFYKIQMSDDRVLIPVIGDELIPEQPSRLVRNHKNLMIGVQTLEVLYGDIMDLSPEPFPLLTRNDLSTYIQSKVAIHYQNHLEMASNLIRDHYVTSNDTDYVSNLFQRSLIPSDLVFNVPTIREVFHKLPYYESIYLYHFEHVNPTEFDERSLVKVSHHSEEYAYLWNVFKNGVFNFTDSDKKVSKFFITSLVNFIKYGNPSTCDFTWPSTDYHLTHVKILPDPKIATDLSRDALDFWDRMKRLTGFDLVTYFPF